MKIIIKLLFYIYFYFFLSLFFPIIYNKVNQRSVFLEGYVEKIATPYYTNTETIALLDEFNKYSDGNAVSYKDEHVFFTRKIHIYDTDKMPSPTYVGVTYPGLFTCDIYLLRGLDYSTYRKVLFHEYLHCFGYNHVDKANDLMYYSVNDTNEDNIKHYAIELGERIKKWKNLKNLSSSTKQTK